MSLGRHGLETTPPRGKPAYTLHRRDALNESAGHRSAPGLHGRKLPRSTLGGGKARGTAGGTDAGRCIRPAVQQRLADALRLSGADVSSWKCCDWSAPCAAAEQFARADILIGMHGAGLANALLGKKGQVLVELKGSYRYESDLFRKLAQSRSGGYVAAATSFESVKGLAGIGSGLSQHNLDKLVDCTLDLWRGSKTAAHACPRAPTLPKHLHAGARQIREGLDGAAEVAHTTDCKMKSPSSPHYVCWSALGLHDPAGGK